MLPALLLVVGTMSARAAASATHPYRASSTRRCLNRRGAHVATQKPLLYDSAPILLWDKRQHNVGNSTNTIVIAFYPSPAAGLTNERQARNTFHVDGFTPGWIRHHLTRRQNVVVSARQYELNSGEIMELADCLHS
jgi:hypothetical protein